MKMASTRTLVVGTHFSFEDNSNIMTIFNGLWFLTRSKSGLYPRSALCRAVCPSTPVWTGFKQETQKAWFKILLRNKHYSFFSFSLKIISVIFKHHYFVDAWGKPNDQGVLFSSRKRRDVVKKFKRTTLNQELY